MPTLHLQQQYDQVEKSVTDLLVATKLLLETLTQWSKGSATDSEVSDIYVRLGYGFHRACRAFSVVGVETSDLGPVPDLLRAILEDALSQEASRASLDRFFPRIKDLIINLLKGLNKKQAKLRHRFARETDSAKAGNQGPTNSTTGPQLHTGSASTTSPPPEGFNLQKPSDDWVIEQAFETLMVERLWINLPAQARRRMEAYSPSKKWDLIYADELAAWQSKHGTDSATGGESSDRPDSEILASSMLDSLSSSPPSYSVTRRSPPDSLGSEFLASPIPTPPSHLPPPTPDQQDGILQLQRGGDLERRASRRLAAYQLEEDKEEVGATTFISPENFNLKKPSDRITSHLFREMMVKRGWMSLPEQARKQMEAYPPSKKWTLIYEWQSEQRMGSVTKESSIETLSSGVLASSVLPVPSVKLDPAESEVRRKLQAGEMDSVITVTPKKSSVDLGGKFRRTFERLTFGERSKSKSPLQAPAHPIANPGKELIGIVHSTSSVAPDWESESTKIYNTDSSNLRFGPLSSRSDQPQQYRTEIIPSEDFHQDFQATEEEPYQSIRYLGHGGSGSVDEVVLKSDPSRKVYARKQVYLARRRRNAIFEQLKQEALIIRSLHHRHIVEVVGTYTWSSRFSIIMLPVADTDLGKYLEELDSTIEEMTMKQQVERLRRTNQFNTWIVCLILAVDYLHEKRIKHRDIKPSNILVRNNTIYLTDFGTSRIIPEDATTGTASIYGPMTRRYVAPEALRDSERRGRSTDIFSLGCVFLEMATIQKGHNGARDRFSKLRHDSTGLSSFAENPYATLQWINYLGSLGAGSKCHALDLAFLMLDPDSKQRITARQLITVIVTISTEEERPGMQLSSCDKCYQAILETDPSSLHSRFRAEARRDYPEDPEAALNTPPPHNWEAAKKKWLHSHMWWTN